jgi:hypothetical protein
VFLPARNPILVAAWQKPIPAIAKVTTSAIMAVSHDLLDLRAVGNAHVEQGPVIEFGQRRDGRFDLSFPFARTVV